jgi:hypothetical protein
MIWGTKGYFIEEFDTTLNFFFKAYNLKLKNVPIPHVSWTSLLLKLQKSKLWNVGTPTFGSFGKCHFDISHARSWKLYYRESNA